MSDKELAALDAAIQAAAIDLLPENLPVSDDLGEPSTVAPARTIAPPPPRPTTK